MAVVFTLVQEKTNKNKFTYTSQYKKHSTNDTKHSKYKYTYHKNTHTSQNPHTHIRTLQNKLKQLQYKLKQTQYKIYPN